MLYNMIILYNDSYYMTLHKFCITIINWNRYIYIR